jgi:hypothetical protein
MSSSTLVNADLLSVARRYAERPDDWPLAPRFNPTERWYHRLHAADDREVWLLTWLPGQATDLHDHGGSAGAFVVVSGVLTEHTVSGVRLVPTALPSGAGRRFDAHHVHRLGNEGTAPAVSVHAYGPRLSAMTRYEFADGELRTTGVDRAGVQW